MNGGENNKIFMRSWEIGEREEVAKEMVSFLPEKLSENNFYFFNSTKRKNRIQQTLKLLIDYKTRQIVAVKKGPK